MSDETTLQTSTLLSNGIWRENPVFVQVLGLCPVMAVTNSALNGLVMGLATLCVLVMSSTLISLFRNLIPPQVRIAIFILIIATFVTMIDYILAAISLDLHAELGAFISLIVVNCMILGRAEAFASKQPLRWAVIDGLAMGSGFTLALLCLGGLREILGKGSFFGIDLFGPHFEPWVVMILPSGGFFSLAIWLLLFAWFKERQQGQEVA
jgi:electron transport complex protein RnfE